MSITIPAELAWLGWIAGSDWPDGDEDKMWAIADDWRTAAAEIRDLLPDLAAAKKATIEAYPWGDGVEAMTVALNKLDRGPESLAQLAETLDYVAESADALATEIEYTKILVISALAMLAVEIAAAWFFPPTAPLVEAAALAATRVAVRLLGQRAVSAIARFAAKTGIAALAKFTAKHVAFSTVLGAGQDVAIQAYQVGAGHRDGMDWNRVGTTAYTAAAAGAVGGPAGGLLGKAAAKVALPGGRWGGAFKGAVVGAGSGMVGAVGAWGVGGIANGWTWDPRLLTSGAAYGVLTGGSKGFRHSAFGRGPGAGGFRAAEPARFVGDGSLAPVRSDNSAAGGRNGIDSGSAPRTGDLANSGAGNSTTHGEVPGASSDGSSGRSSADVGTRTGDFTQADSGIDPRKGDSRAGVPKGTAHGDTHEVPSARAGESGTVAGPKETQAIPADGQSRGVTPDHSLPDNGVPQVTESHHPMHPNGDGTNFAAPPEVAARPEPAQQTTQPSQVNSGELGAENTVVGKTSLGVGQPDNGPRQPDVAQPPNQAPGGAQAHATASGQMSTGGETHARPSSGIPSDPQPKPPTKAPDSLRPDSAVSRDDRTRHIGEEAFARRAHEFAERTAALEGAGLRPNELMVQRRALQREINEFLMQRNEFRANLDQQAKPVQAEANISATQRPTPAPPPDVRQQSPSAQLPTADQTPRPISSPDAQSTSLDERAPVEVPDTTSKIPYTPRYFGVPPIPQYEAPEPPPDSVWKAEPGPGPGPEPELEADSGPELRVQPCPGPGPDPI